MNKFMTKLETILSLCKRRGFVFPGSDIYGGLAGTWDWGPLGVLMKENIKREWWKSMLKPHIYPLDSAILENAQVLEASGHVENFTDPLAECKKCKRRFRADHLVNSENDQDYVTIQQIVIKLAHELLSTYEERDPRDFFEDFVDKKSIIKYFAAKGASDSRVVLEFAPLFSEAISSSLGIVDRVGEREDHIEAAKAAYGEFGSLGDLKTLIPISQAVFLNLGVKCENCKSISWSLPRRFNMMFKTHAGAVEDDIATVYLRPETAQGIFINFKNVVDAFHPKLAFGIAQIGKAFRNEITPRNFLFRAREFEQMELEYFADPKDAEKYFGDIRQMRMDWFLKLGIKKENLRFHDYKSDELAHYAKATTDIEYRFGLSADEFGELEGIANRTDFDLKNHFPDYRWTGDEFIKTKEGFVPYVLEPSVGVDRAFLAFLMDAYEEDEMVGEKRVVLKLNPKIAPVKVAVFPLVGNKENIVSKAKVIFETLQPQVETRWDDIGNIGKRYRRQDEIGTPWCITIDYQTLEDNTVTVRDRDTGKQERDAVDELQMFIERKLK